MGAEKYKYRCSGCVREIATSPDMVDRAESCPYCQTRNLVDKTTHRRPDAGDLYNSAVEAVVCGGLSLFGLGVIVIARPLLIIPMLLGIAALAVGCKAVLYMPADSDLAVRTYVTAAVGMCLSAPAMWTLSVVLAMAARQSLLLMLQ